MTGSCTLYGWPLSYYTGKVHSYLRYKGIPFRDAPADLFTLTRRIKRRTGSVVMPVVVTQDGDWLQDSSAIIDRFERDFSAPSVLPHDPVRRFAAMLLETWFDEWWIPVAMHTRWNHPENYALFERDAGAALLPFTPRVLRNMAAARIAARLRGYLPHVGIRPGQTALIEADAQAALAILEAHFASHAFLLGSRPTIADFGLAGPILNHLGRDPWPRREWIDKLPGVAAWQQRMATFDGGTDMAVPDPEHVPATLDPIFHAIAAGFLPMAEAILARAREVAAGQEAGALLPRGLGDVSFPMAGAPYSRAALPFVLWKVRRLQDLHHAMPQADGDRVAVWLRDFGLGALLTMDFPPMWRVGLMVGFRAKADPTD